MTVDGRCHCGESAAQDGADTADVPVCHCADSRVLDVMVCCPSEPVRVVDVTLPTGPSRIGVKERGHRRPQVFCGTCGIPPLCAADAHAPRSLAGRLPALRRRDRRAPGRRTGYRSMQSWVLALDPISHIDQD